MELVGRDEELKTVAYLLKSNKSELAAIIGRRRVGKTFFVRESLKGKMDFTFTGLYQGTLPEHMNHWANSISKFHSSKLPIATPKNWFDAFQLLQSLLESKKKTKRKKVIFLDEIPWMSTNKSRFLTAFTAFWNDWASAREDVLVVICGSAASWMINKVLKNKGGLHNRVTQLIHLYPFDLHETEQFLKMKRIVLDQYSITQLYMVMGGIPHYLDQIRQGESASQAIDRLCFTKNGLLQSEYQELFSSLFNESQKHRNIVKVLSSTPRGITRETLITKTKLNSGGGFSRILEELIESGFVTGYIPFGKKKKQQLLKLTDPYSLFYNKYINKKTSGNKNSWQQISKSPTWASWSGLAFENLCMLHIYQIKQALGIGGIQISVSSWHHIKTDEIHGAQIDLLIDRADGIINLCEMKYSNYPFTITGKYANNIRNKIAAFQYWTKTRKSIFPTLITTHSLEENIHSNSLIQNTISVSQLFVKDVTK